MQTVGGPTSRLLRTSASGWLAVSALIAYSVQMFLQILPDSKFKDIVLAPVKPITDFFGLNQRFSVFAPNVSRYSIHVRALVCTTSGALFFFDFPRMESLSQHERYRQQGMRKWIHDNLMDPDRGPFIYPDACRYVINQLDTEHPSDPTSHPEFVTLIAYHEAIYLPNEPAPPALPPQVLYVYRTPEATGQ